LSESVRLSSQAYNRCQTYKRIIKNKSRNPVSRTAAGTLKANSSSPSERRARKFFAS
jgi:hypothetical protein